MQLDLLWKYMQVDMEAEKFESDMRNSESRQQLLKQRNFLLEQQASMSKLEDDVSGMLDRLEAVRDETERLQGVLNATRESLENDPPKTIEEAETRLAAAQKLMESLAHYEQELKKAQKDAQTRDRQQKEIRIRAARTKADFDVLKAEYDKEFKRDSEKLTVLRAASEAEAKQLDAALLAKYRQIKQHSSPPMAKLIGNQCGGCFMSLPSAMLKKLAGNENVVECDNCGRIIYIEPES